jgi:hypothetical protein
MFLVFIRYASLESGVDGLKATGSSNRDISVLFRESNAPLAVSGRICYQWRQCRQRWRGGQTVASAPDKNRLTMSPTGEIGVL